MRYSNWYKFKEFVWTIVAIAIGMVALGAPVLAVSMSLLDGDWSRVLWYLSGAWSGFVFMLMAINRGVED